MQFKLNPQTDVSSLFPTPLARFQIPNAGVINPGLEKAILEREKREAGGKRSNIGGWQSSDNLADWKEPEVVELVDSMRCAVLNMVSIITRVQAFEANVSIMAWANVNRSGSFNQVHTHPHNHWSGVYYVSPGDFDDDDVDFAGQLQIHDPRERADMYMHPNAPFGKPFRVEPREGLMILFPSWLGHSVNVFHSTTTRISIAFNAQLLNFKPQ
ncbi:MAG: TIGR02466 family protein [Xanthomonadales bacterium]|nr:TIGR02466 family protein [Xanthomonadales bacterium]